MCVYLSVQLMNVEWPKRFEYISIYFCTFYLLFFIIYICTANMHKKKSRYTFISLIKTQVHFHILLVNIKNKSC